MNDEALESDRHYTEGAKQYIARSYTHVISDFTTIHIAGENFAEVDQRMYLLRYTNSQNCL